MSTEEIMQLNRLASNKIEEIMDATRSTFRIKRQYHEFNVGGDLKQGFSIKLYQNIPLEVVVGVTNIDLSSDEKYFEVQLLMDRQIIERKRFPLESHKPDIGEMMEEIYKKLGMIISYIEYILE